MESLFCIDKTDVLFHNCFEGFQSIGKEKAAKCLISMRHLRDVWEMMKGTLGLMIKPHDAGIHTP